MSEVEDLNAQLDRLRSEGLRQMESWDAEKRESQRLTAAVDRYKHLVADLEEKARLARMEADTERERVVAAEEAVQILKVRVDELLASFTSYGDHQRECQKRSLSGKLMMRDLPCTCGYDKLVAGGG